MKYRLLDLMVCPVCHAGLDLHGIEETGVRPDRNKYPDPLCRYSCSLGHRSPALKHQCNACMQADILTGILQCQANDLHTFPIVNGIPRMLPAAMNMHADIFAELDLQTLPKSVKQRLQKSLQNANRTNGAFQHIQNSFSAEWEELSDHNFAWGRDLNERRQLYLQCLNISESDLSGAVILDAGTGHGEVIMSIADTGAEIVGMDLSFSIDLVARQVKRLPLARQQRIHLVQGNVCQPPFRRHSFDHVHSAGVLHHNPDTYAAFATLSTVVKPAGLYYIEVYSGDYKNRIETFVWRSTDLVKLITTRLPHRLLHWLCYMQVPFYMAYHYGYNRLTGTRRYRRRSFKEMELSIFDGLSPKYAWHHSSKEVANWFAHLGFHSVRKTFYNHNGIGMVGQAPVVAQHEHTNSIEEKVLI